jgi:hypothetical protein
MSLQDVSCQETVELVTDYLERRLDGALAATFEQHVASCGGCTTHLRRARQTIELLAALGNRAAPSAPAPPAAGAAGSTNGERYLKFLGRGAIGPFSGVRWPLPGDGAAGAWIAAEGRLRTCENGIHACRPQDLPHWIGDELWIVELEGDVEVGEHKVVARRGRLVRRVEAWDEAAAARFAAVCAWRTRDLATKVLRERGRDGDATALAACSRLKDVVELEDQLTAQDDDRGWAAYLYAQTAAQLADEGDARSAVGTAALAAAHHAGSERGEDEERAWQATKLWALLGLESL